MPRIRAAVASDAEGVASLLEELGYPSTPGAIRSRLERIAGSPQHIVRVAESESGRVTGCIHATVRETLTSDQEAEIDALIVTVPARRMGVGRALLRAVEAWAKAQGCRAIRVRTNVMREQAPQFYVAAGFERLKTQHVLKRAV